MFESNGTLEIVFYKANFKWYGRIIKWWTRGIYSHCEFYYNGQLIGISDNEQVRKLKTELSPDKWDRYTLKGFNIYDLEPFFNANIGKKYDWIGIIFGNFFNAKTDDKDRYTCSEFCIEAIDRKFNFIYPKNYINISPNDLYRILKDKDLITKGV